MAPSILLLATFAGIVAAQAAASSDASSSSASASESAMSAMASGSSGMATGTVSSPSSTVNASNFMTTMEVSVEDLWNMFVGPVEVASITTTVSATPIPSSSLIPPPPLYYSPFPSGQEVPMMPKNESWKFPKDFWWGVASAAYQVEGAVKDEGRGPSIWDVLTHRATNFVVGNVTGDVTDNEYYLYKTDIARMAALGVKAYSFSISWSRVMPFGRGQVNEQALAHYEDVIDTCLQYGVQPIVTLYHWDLPMFLQNLYGGWLSEDVVDDFVAYAKVVFQRYGNKVQHWFTVNEPIVFCSDYPLPVNYFRYSSIPPKQQPYHCGQSVLLAHAKTYHAARNMSINGTIAFKTNGGYKIPLTTSSADAEAVQRAWDFNEGWFANPTFLGGDYPKYLKEYTSTFLRNFTDDEKSMINGTVDIFAHDAYTSQFYYAPDGGIAACTANSSNPLFPTCANTSYSYPAADGGWNIGYAADPGSPWLHKATDWVPRFLHYIQDTWKPSSIAITEFGFAEPYEQLKLLTADIQTDLARTMYFHDYLRAIMMAIAEGVNVVGCLAWSHVDNLEWGEGFSVKFGMQYVNFTTQERFYKASFFEYSNTFKTYQET